jgi:hypothetical protein
MLDRTARRRFRAHVCDNEARVLYAGLGSVALGDVDEAGRRVDAGRDTRFVRAAREVDGRVAEPATQVEDAAVGAHGMALQELISVNREAARERVTEPHELVEENGVPSFDGLVVVFVGAVLHGDPSSFLQGC